MELTDIIERGEDSQHQFKEDIRNAESLAGDMVAFANARGGMIIIGCDDNGKIKGLDAKDVRRLNQLVGNTANQNVKDPINPFTENVKVVDDLLMVVHITEGINKPYMDNKGVVWVKSGSDKRRVTSKEELRRLFQSSDLVNADEVPVNRTTENDIDLRYFREFYQKAYEKDPERSEIPLAQVLRNLNIARNGHLNIAGLMLFGKEPEKYKTAFVIKAVSFVGNDPAGDKYRDSVDIKGKLEQQYIGALSFFKRNLRYIQGKKGINTLGDLEIPEIVLEELIVNALIHRNYFINAPIRLFIFDNRIEIISPGRLPNNLTIDHIKNGIANIRNDTITSFAGKGLLPYRGMGTGIRRAIRHHADIDFVNDTEGEQFMVMIRRPDTE